MHRYAVQTTDVATLQPWMFMLGGASLAIFYACEWVLAKLVGVASLPSLQAPSAFVIFTLLFSVFDKFAWRWRIIRFLGRVTTPDLNGSWVGHIRPAKSDPPGLPMNMSIRQTFLRISIIIETDISHSRSFSASIEPIRDDFIKLSNEYKVEKKAAAEANFQNHEGVNNLKFDIRAGVPYLVDGSYYTQAERDSHGFFVVDRGAV